MSAAVPSISYRAIRMFWRTQQEGEILARDTLAAHAVVSRRRKRRLAFQLHMWIFPSSFITIFMQSGEKQSKAFSSSGKTKDSKLRETAAASSELPRPHFETRGLNKLALRKREPMRMCGMARI